MLDAIIADFQTNMWLYLSMPLTSGIVGYTTNVIAIKMMFYPLNFWGIKPFLGWQGVVPRKCNKMAQIACDTIVPKLVSQEEVFARLDPERIAKEMEKPVTALVENITEQVMSEFEPTLWETLPLRVRDKIIQRVQNDAPEVVAKVMQDVKDNLDNLFDLKAMVVNTLARDKDLINRIFLETGRDEFKFIGKSGFYFGFAFGVLQMIGWLFFKATWQLPVFGLVVGYATNWIALRMIFRPQFEKKFGPVKVQGLFHKRQKEVSRDYAKMIAEEIVTPSHIIEGVLLGPNADRMFDMVAKNVKRAVDEQAGILRPFVAFTVGTRRYAQMKEMAARKLVEDLPGAVEYANAYATEAMDIRNTLSSRLQALPPDEFEEMLRPAFREDEWMLISVGAALGFAVGLGQVALFTAFAVAAAL